MRRLVAAATPGLRQLCLQQLLTAGAHPANAAECAALLQRHTIVPNVAAGRFFSNADVLDASTAAPGAGGSPQPTPYQPAAPDAAAGSGDPVAQMPESAHSGSGAIAAAQDGASSGAASARPAARAFTKDELFELSQAAHSVQQQMSDLLTQRKPAEALQLFDEHLARCHELVAEVQPAPGSNEQRATRPKYAAFKMAMMAVKAARVQRPMARIAGQVRDMWVFGHTPKYDIYEPALAAAGPMDKRQPPLASEALIAGRLTAEMLERGVRPNGQCFYLAIMANADARELTMACWLVRQLGEGKADLTNTEPGCLRTSLTNVLLACARAGRMDDAAHTLQVAATLGVRINAGALQAVIPFVAEALRCDMLRIALDGISKQFFTQHRQTMPIKLDEGTLLAILNAAAHERDALLARMAWNMLERSLVQPTQRPLTAMPAADSDTPDSAAAQPAEAGTSAAASSPEVGSAADPGSEADQQRHLQQDAGQQSAPGGEDSSRGARQRQHHLGKDLKLYTPCIPAFHSMIHALAAGGDLRGAFAFIRQLAKQHAGVPSVAAWYLLPSLVDQVALSVTKIDEAYFVLEDMHAKGEEMTVAMLNIVVAACCQVGDLARAFETYEAMSALGLIADVDTYNALIWGCSRYGQNASVPKLLEELQGAGFKPNARTHELRADSAIIAGDVPGMLAALQDLVACGQQPSIALLERCVMRAERSANVPALRLLMGRLDLLNYKIVGAAAKLRRWDEEGGMPVLVGTERFVSRPMSGGYKHPDIIRPPTQQQHVGEEVFRDSSLEPDIALEDWGAAAPPPPQQPLAHAAAAAHM